ncbi:RmlC-like cupin domain-containing protein [Cladorrhinum samala]|uniref:RmlC-like cupin domain-containing protein n=1 Tax=Cladorrhinum samala TaxID=585594 RepID=A0AAV9HM64_9PEZI|nr:RmlC-like cupin domain-containing protein [Cladorrhinum samala]
MLSKTTSLLLALSSLAQAAPRNLAERQTTPPSGLSLTAQLTLADNAVARYNLLKDDSDFIFDWNNPNSAPTADRSSFPALVGTGIAMTVAEVPPCSVASVHIHPRASEILVVTSGRLISEMVTELGVVKADGDPRLIHLELSKNQTTVFPMGTIHGQMNPDCAPASLVAGFNSEDPGTAIAALDFFSMSDEFVVDALGESVDAEEVKRIRGAISRSFVFQVQECKKKCGSGDVAA